MKRLLLSKTILAAVLVLCFAPVLHASVTFDASHFPDANFRTAFTNATGISLGTTFNEASVTSLDVSNSSIQNLTGLELLTGLTSLDISGNSSLATGADLTGLTALNTLIARNCNLVGLDGTTSHHSLQNYNGAGLKISSGNSSITYLDLSDNPYFYVSGNLQYLTHLETLLIKNCTYYDYWGYQAGLGMANLKYVDVSNCPAMTSVYLRGATQLKRLNAEGTAITGFYTTPSNTGISKNYIVLSASSPVEYINIGNCAVTQAGLNGITTYGASSLDTLIVKNNPLNGAVTCLQSLTALRYLDMSNTGQPQSSTIGYSAINNKLETLILKNNASFGWSAAFQYLKKLKFLDISGCNIYFREGSSPNYYLLHYLTPSNNPDLETLLVSNSKLGTNTTGLTGFSKLKTVDVSDNHNAAHFWVNESPLLETLDISGNTGLTYLQLNEDALPRSNFNLIGAADCASITSLYLNGNNYSSVAGATSDFASIGGLKFLYLENNSGFTGGALTMNANDCGTLTGIDLGNNGFTSFTAASLPSSLTALMLGDNPALTRLEMHNNPGITTMTASPTMSDGSGLYLLGNSALTYMDISGTEEQPNHFQRIGNNSSLQGVPIDTIKASYNKFYTFRNLTYVPGDNYEIYSTVRNVYLNKVMSNPPSLDTCYYAYWPASPIQADSASVEQLTGLKYLDLSHCNLKDSVYLHKNTELRYLDVSHNRSIARYDTSHDKGAAYRASIPSNNTFNRDFPDYKKYLWLTTNTDDREYYTGDYNDTTGLYILDLMDNDKLEYLDISYTGIEQTALTHCHVSNARYIWIQDLHNLKYFYSDYNGMRSMGIGTKNGKHYREGLKSLERLSSIGMRGTDDRTMQGSINFRDATSSVCTKLHYINLAYSRYDSIGTYAPQIDTLIVKGNPIHYVDVQKVDSITYIDARECAFKMRGYDVETGNIFYPDVSRYKNGARIGGTYNGAVTTELSGLRAIRAFDRKKLATVLLDNSNGLTDVYCHHDPALPKIHGFENLAYNKSYDSQYGFPTVDADSLRLVWVNDNRVFNELNLMKNVNLQYLHAYNDKALGDALDTDGMQLLENVILKTAWVSNSNLQKFINNADDHLDTLKIWQNPELSELVVARNTKLKWLDLHNCQVRTLDMSHCDELTYFDCCNLDSINEITGNPQWEPYSNYGFLMPGSVPTSIDEPGLNSIADLEFAGTSLKTVIADRNDLFSLKGLKNNAGLETLTYSYNHINAIDLSGCNNITTYDCTHNGRGAFEAELSEWFQRVGNRVDTCQLYYLQLDPNANDELDPQHYDSYLGFKWGHDSLEAEGDNAYFRMFDPDGFNPDMVANFIVNSDGPFEGSRGENPQRDQVVYNTDSVLDLSTVYGVIAVLDTIFIQAKPGYHYIEYEYYDGRQGPNREPSTSTYYMIWSKPPGPTEVKETPEDGFGEPTVVSERYYDINGVEHSEPFDGMNIIVRQMSDGTTRAYKVLK